MVLLITPKLWCHRPGDAQPFSTEGHIENFIATVDRTYFIYSIYNRFKNFDKMFGLDEPCEIKSWEFYNIIDKISLTYRLELCTTYVRVATVRDAQSALAVCMRPSDRSLHTSAISKFSANGTTRA